MKKKLIGKVSDFENGKSKKFSFKKGKETLDCFVVGYQGKIYGYINRCKHVSLQLDWGDNDFFTEDNELLMCKNHGALYQPNTGECISGPCAGQSLDTIKIKIEKGKVWLV